MSLKVDIDALRSLVVMLENAGIPFYWDDETDEDTDEDVETIELGKSYSVNDYRVIFESTFEDDKDRPERPKHLGTTFMIQRKTEDEREEE